jgi:hypothetical protein
MTCFASLRRALLCGGLVCFVLALGVSSALAAPMALLNPGLTGTTQYDEWLNTALNPYNPVTQTAQYNAYQAISLNSTANPGYPGFASNTAWPAPIGSAAPGSGDATLNKISGSGNPGGASVYFGTFTNPVNGNGGTQRVSDATPVPGVEQIVFQIQIGEANGYDFFNHALPTLSYNAGSQNLAATSNQLLEHLQTGTFQNPDTGADEPVFTNTYLLSWDVSALGVTSFGINFNGALHAQVYAMRLDQTDVLVPEPGTLVLAGAGLMGLAIVARKRRVKK